MGEKKEEKPGRELNLFRGLGAFLSVLTELAEKAERGETKSGEFGPKGAKVKYRYSVGTLKKETSRPSVGIPRPEARRQISFGKDLQTIDRPSHPGSIGLSTAPESTWTRKMRKKTEGERVFIDVFDEGDHILVVTYLPSLNEEDIETEIEGNNLTITANTPGGKFKKNILIPRRSEVDSINDVSFKHGVLQIKLGKVGRA